jgi:hypothetical protein
MNAYKTPCSPLYCTHYAIGTQCTKESECIAYTNYQALKAEIKRQKAEYGQLHDLKAHGVDCVYVGHRDNKRVGQR